MIKCWSCTRPKDMNRYLCANCWFKLPLATRASLNKQGTSATVRLLELRKQIRDGVDLANIEVTP